MTTTGASRIMSARRALRAARIAIVAGSAVLFGATFAAARASHPAHASSTSSGDSSAESTSVASTPAGEEEDGSFGFGSGSIGPSTNATPSFGTSSS